ncbi:hypothetical protein LJC14_04725 [Treponema sp. OttesenSCG-928-L16]|nr:hypothetical protein [Treponema sp. OttesenSCG-928-L16]
MKITPNMINYIANQMSDDITDLKFGAISFMLTVHENEVVDISRTISNKDRKYINKLINQEKDENHVK